MALKRSDLISLCGDIYQHDDRAAPQWKDEAKWCVLVEVPDGFEHVIATSTGKQWKRVYLNKLMRESFLAVLWDIRNQGLEKELNTFDGCYQIRKVRGEEDRWSVHSHALALDFNAATNQLGTDGDMNHEVAKIFEKHGFIWGKNFKRKDPMHYQFVDESE